jgi:hypothetical protein
MFMSVGESPMFAASQKDNIVPSPITSLSLGSPLAKEKQCFADSS